MFAQVNQVQNILFEARAAKAHTGSQKVGADAAIQADGVGHLRDVGLSPFAKGGNGVDGRDALGQESVGC